MSTYLRVLIIEDQPAYAEFMIEVLRSGGFSPEWRVVETESDYIAHLNPSLDVIISDYSLPRFGGLRALELLQERGLDIPLIVVTGSVAEEAVAEALKQGAADYLLKSHWNRLPIAVKHVLEQKQLRIAKVREEEQLKEAREYSRYLIDSSLDMIISVDKGRRIIEFNRAAQETFGYNKAEVLGKSVNMLYADPEEGSKVHETVLRTGQCTAEIMNLRKDGGTFPSFLAASILEGGRGETLGVMGISREITEHKRVVEAEYLRTQELEALFNIASVLAQPGSFEDRATRVLEQLVKIAQADWAVLRVPDENKQGLRLVAAAGPAIEDSPPPPLLRYSESLLGPTGLQEAQPVVFNDYPALPGASPALVELGVRSGVSMPIHAHHRSLGLINVVSKETSHFTPQQVRLLTAIADQLGVLLENTRLSEEITLKQELESRMNTFISLASHELRTPTNIIMGFTELLIDRDPPRDVSQDWLKRVYQSSQRLTIIVNDLLNVSRIQSGKITAELRHLPLGSVVEEVLSNIGLTTSKHQFLVDIPPDTPRVVGDWDKLVQVLTNLLDNAVKYSPQGGRITVSARHEPERVVVAVADHGIGIAPHDLEHLFTTFQRIRRPETVGIRGSGLGLYVVKALVELMQGQVWVESELNVGSTFFFSVPTQWADIVSREGSTRAGGGI